MIYYNVIGEELLKNEFLFELYNELLYCTFAKDKIQIFWFLPFLTKTVGYVTCYYYDINLL